MALGLLFTSLALASLIIIRRHGSSLSKLVVCSISGEVCNIFQWLSPFVKMMGIASWLPAVIAIGLTVRGYFLAQPMRYDEASTFLLHVNRGFFHIFFYSHPNNQVFHTLLVRASVALLGNDPVAIRLPAFLAGVLVIPTSFLLARLLFKGKGGFVTSAFAAVFPFLVLYDTMARGYSLVVLLSLWLAILGLRFSSNPSTATCFLMSLITALGILTIPTFLLPAAGLILWVGLLMLLRKIRLQHVCRLLVLPFGIMTVLMTGSFYAPTIVASNGIHTIVSNQFVAGMSLGGFLNKLPLHFSETLAHFIRDVPNVMLFAMLILIITGLLAAARKQDWKVLILVPALAMGASVTLFLNHNIPYPRTWIFFLPFLFILVDAGWIEFTNLIPSRFSILPSCALFIIISSWAVILMNHNVISSYPDTGQFLEAQVVAEFLSTKMEHDDVLKGRWPADAPLQYYLWRRGIPTIEAPYTSPRRQFLFVQPSEYALSDITQGDHCDYLTEGDARKIFTFKDAEVYVRYLSDK
jgi:uncharacterized membrane protein